MVTNNSVGATMDSPGYADTANGWVSSAGAGIPGVTVSDGYEVTSTDDNGIYYLESEKKNEIVFISIPGGYEPPVIDNVPQFFKRLTAGADSVERMDFTLTAVNNERHVVLAVADPQLANRTNDLAQFEDCLTDLNDVISRYKAAGKKAYILTLGDLTWDDYWENWALPDYVNLQKKYGTAVFNTIGNHDHDPDYYVDWDAEQTWRSVMGPNWYSFNLGKVHYVVLDNIQYTATGSSARYSNTLADYQLEWLKKDLAAVTDKTAPLVIALHSPLYNPPNATNNVPAFYTTNGQELYDCLADFTEVLVLSGHRHFNYRVIPREGLTEHNLGAICGTWWWTGNINHAGNHICVDGSVGGYGVYEVNGKNMEWHYRSIGYSRNYQFRTYDRNMIHITAANKYAPNANAANAAKGPEYAGEYATAKNDNEVLINVWGYEPGWTVEVTEGSVPLTVTRVSVKDPLHIISYEFSRLNNNADPSASFLSVNTSHMFRVYANSPSSTLTVKVTDRFGTVYTETMKRPKVLMYNEKEPLPDTAAR
jgi:hypothetical protein